MRWRPLLILAFLFAEILVACGSERTEPGPIGGSNPRVPAGSPSCGVSTAIFTVSPVAMADFFGWVPLGNLAPPGHTFPADHQYIYINDPSSPAPRRVVDVVAPTDIIITHAHVGTTNPGGVTDYTLEFSPCAQLYGQFGHVLSVEPSLLARIGPID